MGQFGNLCDSLLFNTSLPTDLQASKSSFVLEAGDGSSSIMATAIGQGETLVTPFHMALVVSAINNDGLLMTPYVIDRVENQEGDVVEQYEPEEYKSLMSESDASILQEYMSYVVEEGTGSRLSGQSYEAAGKPVLRNIPRARIPPIPGLSGTHTERIKQILRLR